jgi:hypothetical protein
MRRLIIGVLYLVRQNKKRKMPGHVARVGETNWYILVKKLFLLLCSVLMAPCNLVRG